MREHASRVSTSPGAPVSTRAGFKFKDIVPHDTDRPRVPVSGLGN